MNGKSEYEGQSFPSYVRRIGAVLQRNDIFDGAKAPRPTGRNENRSFPDRVKHSRKFHFVYKKIHEERF